MKRLRIWTGPSLVSELAGKLRDAGVTVTVEGTEHVYVEAEGSDDSAASWNILVALFNTHGRDYGLRPRGV